MPNFLILGTAKAGTNSLHHYLSQHPDVYMSCLREPRFFAFEGERPTFRGPGDERLRDQIVTRLEEYRALFLGVSRETAVGEASPVYLYSPKAADRIRHHVPDAKLIVILRNPVERAYSSFLAEVRDGREPLGDFARALEEEPARIAAKWSYVWHYKQRGFYYDQLRRYLDRFDPAQMRIYLYEDWKADNVRILQDMFRFLGVEPRFIPDLSERHNASAIPRSRALHEFLTRRHPVKSVMTPVVPRGLRRGLFRALMAGNLVRPPLSLEVRCRLVEDYRSDILRLQDLLERDLSSWLDCGWARSGSC